MALWENLDLHLSLLNADNKMLRRNALNSMFNEVKSLPPDLARYFLKPKGPETEGDKFRDSDDDEDDGTIAPNDEIKAEGDGPHLPPGLTLATVQQLVKPLLSRLSDPMEKCREISYSILALLFQRLPVRTVVTWLPQTIPVLLERLGGVELDESSEEVRFLALQFMVGILQKVGKELAPFVDDWIRILSVTVVDPYHEVRKISSELISQSAKTLPEVFHYNSERLNKPLCISITHQQSKVRLAVVEAIGDVLLYGSHKCIDEFLPHLTQRLFDPQPKVRRAVVAVIGSWMLDFIDRYSFFHKMLPMIMTGLCDECDQVSELAHKLWEKVGDKYLEENVQEYKDQVDFPAEVPKHYPDDVKRPNFGCRLLTQQNSCKIIPGITNDITDWVETTRQKCAQLLFHIILNCESNITMHTEQTLQCMFKAALDTNPIVSTYVLKSAKLLGYFAPLSTTWTILSSRLSCNPNESALAVTASVISGCEPSLLMSCVGDITAVISAPEISRTMRSTRQFWILQLANSLTTLVPDAFKIKKGEESEVNENENGEKEKSQSREDLFRALLTVLAMSLDCDTKCRAIVELNYLKVASGYSTLEELFEQNLSPVLMEFKDCDILWGSTTPENLIFATILAHGGSAVEKHLDAILDILINQLDPKKDPEVRLNLFTLLSEILTNYGEHMGSGSSSGEISSSSQLSKLQTFVKTIVEDILSPNLVWRAGKTASALRASATSCLLTILENKILSIENYEEICPQVVKGCTGMLEENYHVNRLLATQCLGRIMECCQRRISSDVTHKIYPELLKRLDDEQNEVRVSAAAAISRLFLYISTDYDATVSRAHLDYVINVLVVHLDDEVPEIQSTILETLKIVGALSPSIVIAKCENFRTKHRSPENCDALISYFQTLNVNP